jgi:hypothetical protein
VRRYGRRFARLAATFAKFSSRVLGEVALKPSPCCRFELRRAALGIKVDELQSVLERELRHLAGGVLGGPERAAFDSSAEASIGVTLRSHERMFPHTSRDIRTPP